MAPKPGQGMETQDLGYSFFVLLAPEAAQKVLEAQRVSVLMKDTNCSSTKSVGPETEAGNRAPGLSVGYQPCPHTCWILVALLHFSFISFLGAWPTDPRSSTLMLTFYLVPTVV